MGMADGAFEVLRVVHRATGRVRRVLACTAVALALPALALAWASPAHASSSFVWTGVSTVTENWSSAANWTGEAPTGHAAIGTLTFPRLESYACIAEPNRHPCYISANDLTGVSAEAIQLDDGDSYLIAGEQLALGGGGSTPRRPAAPAARRVISC